MEPVSPWEIAVSAALVVGGAFTLLGAFGLVRFPDVMLRLHGPSKATTLGLGGLLTASLLYFGGLGQGPSVHELLITLFVALTAPAGALSVARAVLSRSEAAAVRESPSPNRDIEP